MSNLDRILLRIAIVIVCIVGALLGIEILTRLGIWLFVHP